MGRELKRAAVALFASGVVPFVRLVEPEQLTDSLFHRPPAASGEGFQRPDGYSRPDLHDTAQS